jgi:hypothetical protein
LLRGIIHIFGVYLQTALAFALIVNVVDGGGGSEEKKKTTTKNKSISNNSTIEVIKTKETRGKRNLNFFGNFGVNRREDGYNYQPSGYSELLLH